MIMSLFIKYEGDLWTKTLRKNAGTSWGRAQLAACGPVGYEQRDTP